LNAVALELKTAQMRYHPNQLERREMGKQLAETIRRRLGW
jgi:hypothetical protein